jgi:hypothetical protein
MQSFDATSNLLARALDARFANRAYLPWFYGANPRGEAIEENVDEDGVRVAHYAVLPTLYRTPAGATPFIFSSNVATDPTVRRGGLFREMAEKVYARAAHTGAPAMVGVGNDASTVVVVERFGWHKVGPMPVRVCVPTSRARALESTLVDSTFLASKQFDDLAGDLDWVPVAGWVQAWDAPFLRWRLSRPDAHYVVHVGPDALAVSTRERAPGGIPAAVLLKVFPRPGARLPVDGAPFVSAACRFEHAPICVYAGHNAHVRIRGLKPPRRFQPSPLNVVLKPLDERLASPDRFRLDTFEFLDMDAY